MASAILFGDHCVFRFYEDVAIFIDKQSTKRIVSIVTRIPRDLDGGSDEPSVVYLHLVTSRDPFSAA
jgi:hypothetical protein